MIKNATHKKPLKTKEKNTPPLKKIKSKEQRQIKQTTTIIKKNCVTCMLRNFPSESVRWVLTGAFPPLSL